jgi:hypothetical protein
MNPPVSDNLRVGYANPQQTEQHRPRAIWLYHTNNRNRYGVFTQIGLNSNLKLNTVAVCQGTTKEY